MGKNETNFSTCGLQDQIEPAPAEGEWRDLNSTCCNLFNRTRDAEDGGSNAQNCDKRPAMANRTLIVRRRTEAEMLDTGEVSWSDLLNGSTSRMSFFSLSSTATLVLLPPILIAFSKFYS